MNIHAIQTGTVAIRPNQRQGKGAGSLRLLNTFSDHRWTDPLPIFAWVIEHPEGVIVIDTGETAKVAEPGYFPSWHPYFKHVKASVTSEQEVGPQLRAIGIQPEDVRWVVLTHLHTDHAGGLKHFPKSEILVVRRAFHLASGFIGKMRGFLPHQWPSWFAPTLIDLEPYSFGEFPNSYKLTKNGDIHIVPTPGHTEAHISVILQDSDISYFFAGDASYTQELMLDQKIDGVALNAKEAQTTLERIRRFSKATSTVYLPSHDPDSAIRLVNKIAVPA